MADQSELDRKYFLTGDTYNCPFCNRGSVTYKIVDYVEFWWDASKSACAVFVQCGSCNGRSMHLTFEGKPVTHTGYGYAWNIGKKDIDAVIFYHQPTAFFTIDERIPRPIRDLLSEAQNSRKSNFLVGASACLRKAIYELLKVERIPRTESDGKGGERERHYEERVKDLKGKRSNMDDSLVDLLAHALTATSDQLHEDSWTVWSAAEFDAVYEAVQSVLDEMYVLPDERKQKIDKSSDLISRLRQGKAVPVAEARPGSERTKPA